MGTETCANLCKAAMNLAFIWGFPCVEITDEKVFSLQVQFLDPCSHPKISMKGFSFLRGAKSSDGRNSILVSCPPQAPPPGGITV